MRYIFFRFLFFCQVEIICNKFHYVLYLSFDAQTTDADRCFEVAPNVLTIVIAKKPIQ